MVYVLCPTRNRPIGGVKSLYRHVDVLNRSGFDATILHRGKMRGFRDFRCTWFDNSTKVTRIRRAKIRDSDYVVLPEIYAPVLTELDKLCDFRKLEVNVVRGPGRKVVFNLHWKNTFSGCPIDEENFETPYTDGRIVATIVASDYTESYMKYAFPGCTTYRIHHCIDPATFFYQPDKKEQICFMPRRNYQDAVQVISILRTRKALRGFRVVPIQNVSEKEAARIMQESLIFLSFGHPEGFSRPPAEAMACGCIVIGYHGIGGREYFKPDLAFPVQATEIVEFARTVEKVLDDYRANPEPLAKRAVWASEFIKSNYFAKRERDDIVRAWERITNMP